MQQTNAPKHIALLGNPNSGKSSLFNQLTGLRQKVGNFPGVTVEKKQGEGRLPNGEMAVYTDFPGAYSLHPTSQDERIVVQELSNPYDAYKPDVIIYIADVTKLEKHFLLLTQLKDLNTPLVLALNMSDIAKQEGMQVDVHALSRQLDLPVLMISTRTGEGLEQLKSIVQQHLSPASLSNRASFYPLVGQERSVAEAVQQIVPEASAYQALLIAHHYKWLSFLSKAQRSLIQEIVETAGFEALKFQVKETLGRFERFTPFVRQAVRSTQNPRERMTEKLDAIFTHRFWGPICFFALMLLVFQAIFSWATFPMDAIEGAFQYLGKQVEYFLPEGWLSSLLVDGLLAGLGGIVVFVPQIAILFFLIAILEELGYMARAAYMFDRVMQLFGLNGRSIVALISGGACAIPAIMSTRTIVNWKERLITILVTPFISCSARIPVYTVLIGFVVPATPIFGPITLQSIAFMGLYLLGIMAALFAALVFKLLLRSHEPSFLMLELPEYRLPVMRNVLLTVWEKVKAFVLEAGKVILIISLILWVLASFGPPGEMAKAEQTGITIAEDKNLDETTTKDLVNSLKMESSFAGHLGKWIEPAIAPLGYDWKIGIALIASFAAREVFVGTMATIYSIGSEEQELLIRERMAREHHPITGAPIYTLATSMSLLLFYVFAMQCMGTLAVVRRETMTWKWPIIQFAFMSALAYVSAFAAYQLLS
ncbi:MAG TPA: ferrous iron transport protein B [Saprospiraceae bacterium]|nr:ferrous iron transport protein B [Saprospiraceae bacterium]HMQ82626.1 ferrous iron transport protein B [Saprospiraceae bacterium]